MLIVLFIYKHLFFDEMDTVYHELFLLSMSILNILEIFLPSFSEPAIDTPPPPVLLWVQIIVESKMMQQNVPRN